METSEKKVIENIIQLRLRQNITKRQLADMLCMSESNYGRIEKGLLELKYEHLAKIAKVFNCNVIDIITYPDVYSIQRDRADDSIETVLQIKLKKKQQDEILKLIFNNNDLELLDQNPPATFPEG